MKEAGITVSIVYAVHDVPGNTIDTPDWNPNAPASTFVRSEVVNTRELGFTPFAHKLLREGITIRRASGLRMWIAPHRIEQIEEEPRP